MLSIIGIKKTIKQHTADMDITDSVDYKISAPPRFYNTSTMSVIQRVPKKEDESITPLFIGRF
jgi:hypothetical protein